MRTGNKSKFTSEAASAVNDFPEVAPSCAPLFDRIRELYLYREPDLLAAVRGGDRREARRLINHLLVHIYSAGEERSELLKGLLLELIVSMSRAAVEAGAPQSEVLGLGFKHLTELAAIVDDEDLSAWLRNACERIFDAVEKCRPSSRSPSITRALDFMRLNLERDLTRDEVARTAGVSSGHLSEHMKERTGRSFVELLRDLRVEKACQRLAETEDTLSEIALACGFCDQSYFTRVFHDARGMTPRQYRTSSRPAASNP
jgi:two-component system response regulator YesN